MAAMYRSDRTAPIVSPRYARAMDERTLRTKSLWLDQLDAPLAPRPTLSGDVDVDVAIVGAGYTGLWTAYALLRSDPSLRVLVVEREMVGFGASGRNGGWCVGELAGGLGGAIGAGGRDAGVRMTRAIIDTVDEVGRVIDAEGIVCGFAKGGVIRLARTVPQVQRQRAEVDEYRHVGFGDDVLRVLDADAATDHLSAPDVLGGLLYGPAARVQPARLVRGLATRPNASAPRSSRAPRRRGSSGGPPARGPRCSPTAERSPPTSRSARPRPTPATSTVCGASWCRCTR